MQDNKGWYDEGFRDGVKISAIWSVTITTILVAVIVALLVGKS